MTSIEEKFAKLGIEHAPGQEARQGPATQAGTLRG